MKGSPYNTISLSLQSNNILDGYYNVNRRSLKNEYVVLNNNKIKGGPYNTNVCPLQNEYVVLRKQGF